MATITEDYVSFETAKLLREKGFKESTLAYAYGQDMISYYSQPRVTDDYNVEAGRYPLPTLQMAMKWLREIHNIDIFPWKIGKGIYSCAIFNSNTGQDLSSDKDFPSEKYEETADAAIKYCLENLI